jgi:hypothetical protein
MVVEAQAEDSEEVGAEEEKAKAYIAKHGKEKAFRDASIVLAQQDSPSGFAAFYSLIYERPPPRHVMGWIKDIYAGHAENKDIVIEAFRGSTKSTTMQAFLAFRIGKEPHKTNLVISAGGDDAKQIARAVAHIIEYSPAWKAIYPHVVPDQPPKGKWGDEGGYTVWDKRVDYDKWKGMISAREGRIPTIIGVGYESTYLPGPHPTGVLLIDDYHSEKNTRTEREARKAIDIHKGTIIPMIDQPDVWYILIGTPWNFKDVISTSKNKKHVKHIYTPLGPDDNSIWPEIWTPDFIEKQRERVGSAIEWARMYELDLEKTKGLTLKRQWLDYYSHEELLKFSQDWPVLIGVDYTSTEDPTRQVGDYFALVVAKVIPRGRGIVIIDGIREKLPRAEAEEHVIAQVGAYPTLVSLGIEAIITGNEFYKDMLGNARLRSLNVAPFPVRFNKSKGHRFENIMAPLFKEKRIRLSDRADNEFIDAFVDEWLNWRGDKLEKDYTNDTLDAVYAMIATDRAKNYVTPIGKGQAKEYSYNPIHRKSRNERIGPVEAWSGNG